MQKIYLLLRNNKQTGPYSLDEIIASELKPFDLIWVEGRSAGWRYPSEIDSLKPYLPQQPGIPEIKSPEPVINQATSYPIATPVEATMKSSGKHIFVSMPSGVKQRINESPAIETKNEIPSQEYKYAPIEPLPAQATFSSEPVSETRYARTLNEVEQDYTNWVFKSKKKKSSVQLNQQTVVFGTIGVLICAALYFGISKMVSKSNSTIELAKTIEQKPKETTAPINTGENEVVTSGTELKERETTTSTNNTVQQNVVTAPIKSEAPIVTGNHKSYSNHTGKKSIQNNVVVKKPAVQPNQVQSSVPVKEQEIIKPAQTTAQSHKQVEAAPKKKGLSAFLNGVFGKLKKKNNNSQESETEKQTAKVTPPMPSETRPNGERHATRRSDEARDQQGSDETETVEEKDFSPQATLIDLEGSERNNSWQLGIYDLKLILLNRNNVPVKSAGVEVLYFDENNRLLEKKTVYFNNIAPRSKGIVRVPDQKWADHTDYKLVSLR